MEQPGWEPLMVFTVLMDISGPRYSITDGLPSNYIRSICVTHQNQVWIGTDKGAGLFAGGQFTTNGSETGLTGPSIARIVEDQDGSLWFCSERWPDRRYSGGLSHYKDGLWSRFSLETGCPFDYVVDYFHSKTGSEFVLTNKGIFQRNGNQWFNPFEGQELDKKEDFRSITESQTEGIIVSSDRGIYTYRNHKWNFIPYDNSIYRSNTPLLLTQKGEIITFKPVSTTHFNLLKWAENRFQPISMPYPAHDYRWFVNMRQAPDGTIWCVGEHAILRFIQEQNEWKEFENIPFPAFADEDGSIWFKGPKTIIRYGKQGWSERESFTGKLHRDKDKKVWGWDNNEVSTWNHGQKLVYPAAVLGLSEIVANIKGSAGEIGYYGIDQRGGTGAALFKEGQWLHFSIPGIRCDVIEESYFCQDLSVWFLIKGPKDSASYNLVHFTPSNQKIISYDVNLTFSHSNPKLYIDKYDRIWLYEMNVYQVIPQNTLLYKIMPDTIGKQIVQLLESPQSLWFLCQGSMGGKWGISNLMDNHWKNFEGDFYFSKVLSDGSVTFGSENTIYLFQDGKDIPRRITLPKDEELWGAEKLDDQGLWIGLDYSVFYYQPDHIPPKTFIKTNLLSITVGEPLDIYCQAVERFLPKFTVRSYAYSWSMDNELWSEFQYYPNSQIRIPTEKYSPGKHVIRVKSRDEGYDIDENPAEIRIEILPVPIQKRGWFIPACILLSIFILFVTLSFLRRRTVYTHRLEKLVLDRTSSLVESERKLASSNQILQNILDTIPVRVFWKDRDLHYLGCNLRYAKDVGLSSQEEIIGKDNFAINTRDTAMAYRHDDLEVIETQKPKINYEELQYRPDGSKHILLTSKVPLYDENDQVCGVLGTYEDITDRKKLEDQFMQSQKMEAIGKLAGGISHDFNNLLTAIIGYANLLANRLHPKEKTYEFVMEIKKAGERAASLTRQLLAYSRKQIFELRVIHLNELLLNMEKMLRRLIGEDIELITAPAIDLGLIKADPGQIEQIILNLTVNARDAMPTGGQLTIETRNVAFTTPYSIASDEIPVGRYVLLTVKDTGDGIPKDIQDKIFEPFFTTKETGKGTGLGLSTVFGIVKQSGGFINVTSEIDHGTVFNIFLPQIQEQEEKEELLSDDSVYMTGSETILFLEDNEFVREFTVETLRNAGYTVFEAAYPEKAINLYQSRQCTIDLLITDMVLPRMNGLEVAKQILAESPNLQVLYISGYTDNSIVNKGVLDEGLHFLQKPFSPDILLRKVREILDGRSS